MSLYYSIGCPLNKERRLLRLENRFVFRYGNRGAGHAALCGVSDALDGVNAGQRNDNMMTAVTIGICFRMPQAGMRFGMV